MEPINVIAALSVSGNLILMIIAYKLWRINAQLNMMLMAILQERIRAAIVAYGGVVEEDEETMH